YYAPHMANIPGFPDGISGHRLLDLQIAAVRKLDQRIGYFTPASVTSVECTADGFAVTFDWLKQTLVARGRAVILAMGVVDRIPVVEGKIDTIFPWANQAIVDFCILCDGHDLVGKSVAVLGHDAFAVRSALDVLHFRPKSVEILTHGHPLLDGVPEPDRSTLLAAIAEHSIATVTSEMVGFDGIREKVFGVRFADGSHRTYERGFSGLGWYDMHDRIPGRSDAGSTPTATSSRTRTAERSRTPPGHRSPVSIVWATSATAGIRSPKRGRPRNGRSFTPGRRTCKDSLPHGGRGVCDGEVMGELGKVLGDRGGSRREETVLAHRRAGGHGLARVRHHGVEAHLRARGAFRIDQVVPDEQGPVDRDAHLAQEEEKSLGGGLHRSGGAAASQVLEIGREFRSNERLASEELRASGEETDAETAQGENLQ